ncbi:arsenite methyltransferase-like [Montipora capricornis]|uniref:arsenite methyltransferase-like n=1 Tax=Montipora capricornis TaxID=246305 RepID=UPI0035F1CAEC
MTSNVEEKVKENVKDYYGKRLKDSDDLQTNACKFDGQKMSPAVKSALKLVHEEVSSKFYGCGLVVPEALEGMHILDLGSGSGQDCFVLSKLVGENGHVTGVDMTKEQVDVANKYVDYHAEQFGYSKPNTDFKLGEMERLSEVGIQDNSIDIIISNCVVNLTANKKVVLKEAHRVLKDGGEVYFSDVYTDTKLSEEARNDEVLWGECVSGALHWKELVEMCKEVGFSGPHLVTARTFEVEPKLRRPLGEALFVSATYRLYKVPQDDPSEAGSLVTYKGSMEENPEEFKFNVCYTLTKTPTLVSADVATVLRVSRFGKHVEFHPLDPGTNAPADDVYSAADPFAYCVANNVKKASGGCCPKPTEQKSGGGCRPKSAEKESACDAKRPKIESKGTCC